MTTDTMVEGVHFFPDCDAESLGHKLLAVNLSDLASMGAKPLAVTLALTMAKIDSDWLQQFANVRMTGTGAGIFISTESPQAAEEIAQQAPADWQCFVTKGLNTSPLYDSVQISNGV